MLLSFPYCNNVNLLVLTWHKTAVVHCEWNNLSSFELCMVDSACVTLKQERLNPYVGAAWLGMTNTSRTVQNKTSNSFEANATHLPLVQQQYVRYNEGKQAMLTLSTNIVYSTHACVVTCVAGSAQLETMQIWRVPHPLNVHLFKSRHLCQSALWTVGWNMALSSLLSHGLLLSRVESNVGTSAGNGLPTSSFLMWVQVLSKHWQHLNLLLLGPFIDSSWDTSEGPAIRHNIPKES